VAVLEAAAVSSLTSLAAGAGCGCKLPAAELLPLLRSLPRCEDDRVLVGSATADDAAVVRVREDLAIVQTVDFFTSPVDDPRDFGRIAAANALSDVYAMGGTPLSALSIVAFPLRRSGPKILAEILAGGHEVAAAAGALLVGGHSIEDPEPKYGLAVTGIVDPRRIVTNAGGRPGDALVLTKPLGTGAVLAASRRGQASSELLAAAVATMSELNGEAARAASAAGVHAMTDVTGFGLLGHLHHLARESGLSATVRAADVPALEGAPSLLEGAADTMPGRSGGSRRNADWAAGFTRFGPRVAAWSRRLLADATTSGGLLAAVPYERAHELPGLVIGRLTDGPAGSIRVV